MAGLKDKKWYLGGIVVTAFLLTPLISAMLFCLKDGRAESERHWKE